MAEIIGFMFLPLSCYWFVMSVKGYFWDTDSTHKNHNSVWMLIFTGILFFILFYAHYSSGFQVITKHF